jgi:hypothetical protein
MLSRKTAILKTKINERVVFVIERPCDNFYPPAADPDRVRQISFNLT